MSQGGRRRARDFAVGLLTTVISLLVFALIAEGVLRFLPVTTGLRSLPVDSANPTLHFTPNREFEYSRGWDFANVNRGRTNNFGWVNDLDYDAAADTPLLAVVGDSYVEAQNEPYSQTLHGRLAGSAAPDARVYSFGASGAPLSQYLAEADYARQNFRPSALVVLVVGNDFDESLIWYSAVPGYHYFERAADGSLSLVRVDFAPDWSRAIVRHSALARYLILHLHALNAFAALKGGEYVGNTAAAASPERVADSKSAVDAFLRLLPQYAGMSPERILLVVDAPRPALYAPEDLARAQTSYFGQMRSYFLERARATGYEAIDMQPLFLERYAQAQQRFESPTDGHWNGLGHEVAAHAVERSRVFAAFRHAATARALP